MCWLPTMPRPAPLSWWMSNFMNAHSSTIKSSLFLVNTQTKIQQRHKYFWFLEHYPNKNNVLFCHWVALHIYWKASMGNLMSYWDIWTLHNYNFITHSSCTFSSELFRSRFYQKFAQMLQHDRQLFLHLPFTLYPTDKTTFHECRPTASGHTYQGCCLKLQVPVACTSSSNQFSYCNNIFLHPFPQQSFKLTTKCWRWRLLFIKQQLMMS